MVLIRFFFYFQILDVNDNPPDFEQDEYSFQILEGSAKGTPIGRIKATDLDTDPSNRRISYSLISEWGSDRFSLDPATGLFTLSASELDAEELPYYVLVASASDGGTPTLTSTTTVYINVVDVNDNPPKFSQAIYKGKVEENKDPKALREAKIPAAVIDASDPDFGEILLDFFPNQSH